MATRWGGFHHREPGPSYVGWGRQIIALSISISIYIYIYISYYSLYVLNILYVYINYYLYMLFYYIHIIHMIYSIHTLYYQLLSYIQLISVLPLPPRRVLSSSPAFCHWPLRAKADREALQATKSAESERSSSRSKACSTKSGWNSGNIWGMPIIKGAPDLMSCTRAKIWKFLEHFNGSAWRNIGNPEARVSTPKWLGLPADPDEPSIWIIISVRYLGDGWGWTQIDRSDR